MFPYTVEYAFRAMVAIALRPEAFLTSDSLAEQICVPAAYFAKIMKRLSQAGLVIGQRGTGGGYSLAGQPDEIRLIDVAIAIRPIQRARTARHAIEILDHSARCIR